MEVDGVTYGYTAGGSGYVAYADSGVWDKFDNVQFYGGNEVQIMASSNSSAFYTNSELDSGHIEHLNHTFSDEHKLQEENKQLTNREIEVLKLIVQGRLNKEIADKLNISLNTVLSHRKNIIAKTGIKTVSGLTFYSISNGYVSPGDHVV